MCGTFKLLVAAILLTSQVHANLLDKVVKKKWGNMEVTWIEDERFPTYQVQIYFSDGALSDGRNYGTTSMMFDGIRFGTNRYSQAQINDALEYYGVSTSGEVFHEYSLFSYSGLVKDIIPTSKMICHLFSESIYPKNELDAYKNRVVSSQLNLSSSHGQLANRVFREISMSPSPFQNPVDGKISDIKRLDSKTLMKQRQYFHKEVIKKVYITGPSDALALKEILLNDCEWGKNETVSRTDDKLKWKGNENGPQVYLAAVPNANQAQIRIGSILENNDNLSDEVMRFLSSYLGDGFTSVLMQETRVKRGLTYSINAVAASQKYYGRSVLATSTRNEKVMETLQVIKDALENSMNNEIPKEKLDKTSGYLRGRFLHEIESSAALLNKLIYLDHKGVTHSKLLEFSDEVGKVNSKQLNQAIKEVFDWGKMKIVIVGSKSLLKELSKIYKVKTVNYHNFL